MLSVHVQNLQKFRDSLPYDISDQCRAYDSNSTHLYLSVPISTAVPWVVSWPPSKARQHNSYDPCKYVGMK